MSDRSPSDIRTRIEWLQRQPTKPFRPQPYEQLAEVLQKQGREEDAEEILIQKNKDLARHTKLTIAEWLWYLIIGPLIG